MQHRVPAVNAVITTPATLHAIPCFAVAGPAVTVLVPFMRFHKLTYTGSRAAMPRLPSRVNGHCSSRLHHTHALINAIILAAGASRRTGNTNKLLLPYRGEPLVAHTTGQVCASKASEIVVVTGFEAEQIAATVTALPVQIAYNQRYTQGMTTSVKAGLHALTTEAQGFMVCLADMPLITAAAIDKLIAAFCCAVEGDSRAIVRAMHEKDPGHPVIFATAYHQEVLDHRGTSGCRNIITRNRDHMVPVELAACTVDIDTQADYERLRRSSHSSASVRSHAH